VQNRDRLDHGPYADLRRTAIDLVETGLAACDPYFAAQRLLRLEGNSFWVGEREYNLSCIGDIYVIGAGKASIRIAQAVEECLGERITAGKVIVKHGDHFSLERIEKGIAAHPLPDDASQAGAREIVKLIQHVRPNDLVISCFTGGSSSLFVSPVDGVTLENKREVSRILLTCGANITEINAVRKHLSTVKGGQIACLLPVETCLINLTVSDVIGDSLDCITDPTVADTTTLTDARTVIKKYSLHDKLPKPVIEYLFSPNASETPKETEFVGRDVENIILVSGDAAPVAARQRANQLGFSTLMLSSSFEGESSELGRAFAAIAREVRLTGNPIPAPCCIIGGGETTVRIGSSSGVGGPNQEFALASAPEIRDQGSVVICAIDTDGTDGPSEFAGAIVDSTTLDRAHKDGLDINAALEDHDVTGVLQKLDCAIKTGSTGTNVNDLKFVLIS